MSTAKATFAKVKAAVDLLQSRGVKPTVTRVEQMVGGSRTTILKHMHALFDDVASQKPKSDIAEAFLTKVAAKLVESVWGEASTIATAEMQQRVKTLVDINTAIAEGMSDLVGENEALRARVAAAEARAADAEMALTRHRELEDHLRTLSQLVHRMQDEPLDPTMFDIMRTLSQLPQAPDREELHRRLVANGHDSDKARGARHKVVKELYVEEVGSPPKLHLTDKGRTRLAKAGIEVPTEGKKLA